MGHRVGAQATDVDRATTAARTQMQHQVFGFWVPVAEQSAESSFFGPADVVVQESERRDDPKESTPRQVRMGRPLARVRSSGESQEPAEEATASRGRRRRTHVDSIERRAMGAGTLVAIGRTSSSSGWQRSRVKFLGRIPKAERALRDPLPSTIW